MKHIQGGAEIWIYLYEIFVGALFLHARIVVTMIRELSERAASEY